MSMTDAWHIAADRLRARECRGRRRACAKYNIGNNRPEGHLLVVAVLERAMGRAAKKEMLPTQPGDVLTTYAGKDDLMRDVDFRPQTSIEDGIAKFVAWYRDHYEA
ncbi:hypothetical protein [Bradyrhizobium sp. AUGA SZCCT0160]|uniref:hypothetical protein n=1 Tax=Bradyrhizobium sp. AUGA SZCCT0160 TaxID=2807662 RepID=UPI001BAE058C|nr:hypothetical protein [Bradyrhizobium sp. AUGA SZCCT0160]MBR1190581.1 hypothetical protein [Bradyrhizobium sp. AUGA SZCCT0160]